MVGGAEVSGVRDQVSVGVICEEGVGFNKSTNQKISQ